MVDEHPDRVAPRGGRIRAAFRRVGLALQALLCLVLLVWTLREEQYLFAVIATLLAVGAATLLVRDLRRG